MGGIPGTVANPSPDVVSVQFHPDAAGTPGTPGGAVQSVQGVSGGVPVGTRTNATRNAGVLHRNAITAADKVGTVGTINRTSTTGGSLANSTTYFMSAAAGNRFGNALAAAVVSTATGAGGTAMNLAFAQVTGADYYDLFLSTDSGAPKWVARITEAQRAAGGWAVTAVGTVTQTGSAAAGSIDVRVVGTGLASSVSPFTANNAYILTGITPVNCAGFSRAHLLVKLAVDDLRSLPTLTILPFLANQLSPADLVQGSLQSLIFSGGNGLSLLQDFWLDVDGSTGLSVCVDSIAGHNAAASIWVELM